MELHYICMVRCLHAHGIQLVIISCFLNASLPRSWWRCKIDENLCRKSNPFLSIMSLYATKGIPKAPKSMHHNNISLFDLFQRCSRVSLSLISMTAMREKALKLSITDRHETVRCPKKQQDDTNCCENFHRFNLMYHIRPTMVHSIVIWASTCEI